MNKGALATLTILLGILVVPGCGGGGGSSAPPAPTFTEATAIIGTDGGTITVSNISVEFAPDTSRQAGEVVLRIRSEPFVKSAKNTTFQNGIQIIAEDSTITTRGFRLQVPTASAAPFEDYYFAFGDIKDWTSDFLEIDRINSQYINVSISAEIYFKHRKAVSRNNSGLSISLAVVRQNKAGTTKIYKPTISVFDSETQLSLLETTDTLSEKRTAIVIHGLNNSAVDMFDTAQVAMRASMNVSNQQYDQIWFVDYHDMRKGIADSAKEFATLLKQRNPDSAHSIDIYGHSMGGLIARWAIEKEGLGEYTNRLFTFGTPHLGVPSRVLLRAFFDFPLIPGVRDLASDGYFTTFIDDLKESPSPYKDRILYCTFAGTSWKGYLFGLGSLAKLDYLFLGYQGDIDGIVAINSAVPSNLSNFGVCDLGSGSTVVVLNLDHSDIGGSLGSQDVQNQLIERLIILMNSNVSVGGG